MDRRLRQMEWIGIPVCFLLAVLMHNLYEWSGEAAWVGVWTPVNESVWEHGKLLGVPYLLWSAAEWMLFRPNVRRFITAKTAALYAMSAAMMGFFYLYTAVAGHAITVLDIVSTAVWIALGFWISQKGYASARTSEWFTTAIFALILYGVLYVGFTFNPPHWLPFRDPIDGTYGLQRIRVASTIPT